MQNNRGDLTSIVLKLLREQHAIAHFHLIAKDVRYKSIIRTFKITPSVPNIINLAGLDFSLYCVTK